MVWNNPNLSNNKSNDKRLRWYGPQHADDNLNRIDQLTSSAGSYYTHCHSSSIFHYSNPNCFIYFCEINLILFVICSRNKKNRINIKFSSFRPFLRNNLRNLHNSSILKRKYIFKKANWLIIWFHCHTVKFKLHQLLAGNSHRFIFCYFNCRHCIFWSNDQISKHYFSKSSIHRSSFDLGIAGGSIDGYNNEMVWWCRI